MKRREFLSLPAAVGVSGCAGPQVSNNSGALPGAGRGVIVVSVTNDEETGNRAEPVVYMDSRGAFQRRLLHAIEVVMAIPLKSDFPDVYGTVYVLDVEAGEHVFDGWQVKSGRRRFFNGPIRPLRLRIEPGQVVYAGNIHMVHTLGNGGLPGLWVSVAVRPEVRDRFDTDVPIAESKAASLRGKVSKSLLPLGPWTI